MEASNHIALREHNTAVVFRTIQQYGPLPRIAIVERTGLAESTVSVITGLLQQQNFIRECGYATSTGGRRPILLETNPEGGYFICVNLDIPKMTVGVLNMGFEVIEEWKYCGFKNNGEELFQKLENVISQVSNWCAKQQLRVMGVGIAISAAIDILDGRVVGAEHFGWCDFELKSRLEAVLPFPVLIENDTNAAAYGEFLSDLTGKVATGNMIYVVVGTGLGVGLILDERLYKGATGTAGEIGHVTVELDGLPCLCGKSGCLETIATEHAMVRDYCQLASTVVRADMDVSWLLQCAEEGDDMARQILERAGRFYGIAVGNLVNVLNLDRVVIGGELSMNSKIMREAFERGMDLALLPNLKSGMQIRPSSLGAHASYVGVAHLSVGRLFTQVSV